MLEDHNEVNDMDMVLDSEVKDLLLTWLIRFGRDCVSHDDVWNYLLDEVRPHYPIADTLNSCFECGYLDILQDPFTKQYNHKLTKEGLIFLKRRKA